MRMKNVKNGVMRVMLWDHSAFVLKQVLEHVSRGGGGGGRGTPLFGLYKSGMCC